MSTSMDFSALTLSDGHQEQLTACKKLSDDMLAWLSVWAVLFCCLVIPDPRIWSKVHIIWI